ncbi:MAG: autotransporter-associated beta strand repeat-containing protein [Opitutaceae bacterium]
MSGGATAQVVTVNQSFTGSTLPSSWNYGGNVNNNGTITSFLPTASGTSAGMTLTTSSGNESTYAYDPTAFSSANATIAVQFTYTASNGTSPAADGITFFLADANVVAANGFSPGAFGGSLGYAQKNASAAPPSGVSGLTGGYLGVGIDQYGNYSNPTEGRNGGPGPEANNVAIRGPGSGQNGYNYLGGTTGGLPNFSAPTSGSVSTNFEMTISATNQVIMYMEEGGVYTQIFTADLSAYTRPSDLILGFTGSTGGSDSTQQVANVLLTSVTANLWTNTGADSKWGTTNNWFGNPSSAPGSAASAGNPSDVLLNNAYVSSAQTISLNGNTQTLRALDIDAPFSYTVGSSAGDGTIVFNNEGVLGPSGIYISHTTGTAMQTVNSNLVAKNAINIQNNTTSALNLNGTLDTQGNAVTFNGSGATNVAGVISNSTGSGSIVQSGTGTTTLSGANTYTGGTTISAGILNANNSTALGTGAVALDAGGTLGSTNSSAITNTIALNGSANLSGINSGGTLTETGGSYTLNMANATQSGAVNLSNNNTARTLTVEVDSGTSAISGVIANGGTGAGNLTKTGNGTLTLGGTDTYTGTTTITGGTIQLGKSSVLASTSNLSIGASGTFNLNSFSQQIATLTAAGGATLNFGSATAGNSFLFGTYTAPGSGVLTVNNWSNTDKLATTVASQNVGTIYISGQGDATEQTTTSTVLGNANSYLLLPVTQTTNEWKGGSPVGGPYPWSTAGNWASGVPTTAQVALFNTLGLSNLTSTVTAAASVGGIEFGAGATSGYTITGAAGDSITLSHATYAVPAIQQFSTANQTISGAGGIILTANSVTNETNTGNLTISAPISGAFNLVNDGTSTGKLILTGANSFHSLDNNNGIVQIGNTTAMGTQAATISNGAGLEITGGISPTNALSISGTGVSGAGVLHNVGGANTLSGTITEATDSTIAADSGTTLNLSGNLTGTNTNTTFVGPGTITASDMTTGTGGVTLSSGTLTFNGANTYTGATTVNGGTLNLSGTGVTVNGNLTVNSGAVSQTASNQINTASTVTMNGGSYNLNGNAQTLTALNGASGATVTVGTGGNLTLNGSGTSTYSGALSGAGTITQSGTGELALTGSSAGFTGNVALSQGIVNVSGNNNVLGTSAVAVSGTGNFEVQGGLNLANNFTLSTSGASSGNGAIENISGNNTVSGTVTLAGNSRIQSDAGTGTFSNTLSLGSGATGYTLNVGGTGNTTVSGVIQNGGTAAGSLTKDGTGNLTLSGANTFTGTTAVNAGTLTAGAANVLNTSSGVTVASGATLNLNNLNQTITNLNNSGALSFGSSGGETLTLTGADTLGGTMAGANGTLVVGSGATLTLAAGFNDPNLKIILAGGTLDLNGTTDVFGDLQINANSTLDFASGANSILTVNDISFQNTGLQLSVANWSNEQDYFFSNIDPGSQGSPPMSQIVFDSPTYTGANTKFLPFDNEVSPVPEPATYGTIFVGACLGFLLLRRLPRRKLAVVKV